MKQTDAERKALDKAYREANKDKIAARFMNKNKTRYKGKVAGFELGDYVACPSTRETSIGGSDEVVGFTHGGQLIVQGYGDSRIKTVIPQSVTKVNFPPKPLPEIGRGKTF